MIYKKPCLTRTAKYMLLLVLYHTSNENINFISYLSAYNELKWVIILHLEIYENPIKLIAILRSTTLSHISQITQIRKKYEISFNMTCQIIISIQISHYWLLKKYARFLYRIENEHFLLNLHSNSYWHWTINNYRIKM